jgi:hypothetical protein
MGQSQTRHSRAKAFFRRIYEQSQAQASRRFVAELYCLDYARPYATVRNFARASRSLVSQTLTNQTLSNPILHHLSTCIAIFWVLNGHQTRTATDLRYAIPFTIVTFLFLRCQMADKKLYLPDFSTPAMPLSNSRESRLP